MAAGLGSRLGYLGTLLPKTMVPVHGKPLLWYALRALGDMGVPEAVVATLASNDLVLRYLRALDVRSVGLRAVRARRLQRPTRSPVETLLAALPTEVQGDIALVAGDSMLQAYNLKGFVPEFRRRHAEVAMAVILEPDRGAIQRACEVQLLPDGRIAGIREKPKRPRWKYRGCATMLIRGEVLRSLYDDARQRSKVPGLTDLVEAGARRGTALGFPLEGWEVNVNTVKDVVDSWRNTDPTLGSVL